MTKNENSPKYERVFFQLEKDEEGYPPDDWETLWAFEVSPGLYCIDNVPFFVRGVSSGDVVSGDRKDNELRFKDIVQKSGNSVLRVIVFDESQSDELRDELSKLGCGTEQSHIPSLISVEVPTSVAIDPVLEFLMSGEKEGLWEYEEASLRHRL